MIEQTTSISITQQDITGILGEKINAITNLELQVIALKRTVIELQEEAKISCQCKDEQESNSDNQ